MKDMRTLILTGGMCTLFGEGTWKVPKLEVCIGGYPILWHITKIYSYFSCSDMAIDLFKNDVQIHRMCSEPWKFNQTAVNFIIAGFWQNNSFRGKNSGK